MKVLGYEVTQKEFLLALAFAIAGYVFSDPTWLKWMDTLNPLQGYLVYGSVIAVVYYSLAYAGLIYRARGVEITQEVIGLFMITFAFFIIFNWTNPWVQYITKGTFSGASNVYINNSEDGLTWFFWSNIAHIIDPETIRLLTFSGTTFALVLLGSSLVSGKIKIMG
jgi:hypothetical protein